MRRGALSLAGFIMSDDKSKTFDATQRREIMRPLNVALSSAVLSLAIAACGTDDSPGPPLSDASVDTGPRSDGATFDVASPEGGAGTDGGTCVAPGEPCPVADGGHCCAGDLCFEVQGTAVCPDRPPGG